MNYVSFIHIIISYRIIYHIIYHISYHIISYHIISYHIISHHVISMVSLSCRTVSSIIRRFSKNLRVRIPRPLETTTATLKSRCNTVPLLPGSMLVEQTAACFDVIASISFLNNIAWEGDALHGKCFNILRAIVAYEQCLSSSDDLTTGRNNLPGAPSNVFPMQ